MKEKNYRIVERKIVFNTISYVPQYKTDDSWSDFERKQFIRNEEVRTIYQFDTVQDAENFINLKKSEVEPDKVIKYL